MKLRDKVRSLGSQWPPDWAGSYSGSQELPIGEVGTLTSVKLMEKTANKDSTPYLSIRIDFKGNPHLGIIRLTNPKELKPLEAALQKLVGSPVKAVGDAEV